MEVLRHNVVSPADVAEDQSVPSDVLKKLLPHQLQDDSDDDFDCDEEECDVSGGVVYRPRVTRIFVRSTSGVLKRWYTRGLHCQTLVMRGSKQRVGRVKACGSKTCVVSVHDPCER